MRSLSARTFSITYPKDAFDTFTIERSVAEKEQRKTHHEYHNVESEHIKSQNLQIVEKSAKPNLKSNSQLPKITKRICGKTNRQEYIKAITSVYSNAYDSTRAIALGLQEGGYKGQPEAYELLPEIDKAKTPKISLIQHSSMYGQYTAASVNPEIVVTKKNTRYSSNQEWYRKTSSLVQPADNSSYYLSEGVKSF